MTLATDLAASVRAALLASMPAAEPQPAKPVSIVRWAPEIRAELEELYLTAFRAAWPDVGRDAATAWAARYSRRELARLCGGRYDLDALVQEGAAEPALLARVETLAAWRTAQKASDDPAPDDRSKPVDAFAALLLALFAQLQDGKLSTEGYLSEVGSAFDAAVKDAPPSAAAKLQQLRALALERAKAVQDAVSQPDDAEDAPSEAQRSSMANGVAGALWAATLLVGLYRRQDERNQTAADARAAADEAKRQADDAGTAEARRDARDAERTAQDAEDRAESQRVRWTAQQDNAVCDECDELDGQEFDLDDLPFWPGESDFGGSLPDGTACGPNCRCTVDFIDGDDAESKAAVAALCLKVWGRKRGAVSGDVLKVARCGACHRKLGEQVNADARLFCPRCRETTGLIGA